MNSNTGKSGNPANTAPAKTEEAAKEANSVAKTEETTKVVDLVAKTQEAAKEANSVAKTEETTNAVNSVAKTEEAAKVVDPVAKEEVIEVTSAENEDTVVLVKLDTNPMANGFKMGAGAMLGVLLVSTIAGLVTKAFFSDDTSEASAIK